MRVKTLDDALSLVREAQVVMEASALPGVPSFVEAVVGSRVKGSWWGHPMGKKIFNLAEAALDSGEVLMCKLLDGKRTWIHQESWPLVLRVVLEPKWSAPRVADLPSESRLLMTVLETSGELRAPEPKALARLERAMLAHVASEHTPSGKHVKVATTWEAWAKARGAKPAKCSLDQALVQLKERAGGNPTALH